MKRIIVISIAVASLMMLAGCNKQEPSQSANKGFSLTAAVEQHEGETKTVLDGTSINWVSGDAIKVFDATGKYAQLSTTDGGDDSAHFNQVSSEEGFNEESTPLYVLYPYGIESASISSNIITFDMPDTQKYAYNSFDPACNVAVGAVSEKAVSFKNAFGLLKLSLKGVIKVGKIELTTKGSEKLWGTFTVDASTPSAATHSSGGSTTITLDCDDEGGVQLDNVNATTFYFVVPVGAFAAGFEATVFDVASYSEDKYRVEIETSKPNTISRSKVKAMPSITLSLLDPSVYTEQLYLKATGTQYVNLGYKFAFTYSFDVQAAGNEEIKTGADKSTYIFGSRASGGGLYNALVYDTSKTIKLTIGGRNLQNTIRWDDCLPHKVYISDGKQIVDNNVTTTKYLNSIYDGNMFLFTINYGGTYAGENRTLCSVYYFKCYDDDAIKQYLVPCMRVSDGILGMYDIVSDTFLTNAGSGVFVSGGDVTANFHK